MCWEGPPVAGAGHYDLERRDAAALKARAARGISVASRKPPRARFEWGNGRPDARGHVSYPLSEGWAQFIREVTDEDTSRRAGVVSSWIPRLGKFW